MMRVQIFFAGRHTAAQMTFRFVVFQNRFDLCRKTGIDLKKSFGDIFMYG